MKQGFKPSAVIDADIIIVFVVSYQGFDATMIEYFITSQRIIKHYITFLLNSHIMRVKNKV